MMRVSHLAELEPFADEDERADGRANGRGAVKGWRLSDVARRRWLVGLCGFTAFCALGGSVGLFHAGAGNAGIPGWLLRWTPFATFLVPGLLLGFVGVAHAVAAVALWRRARWAHELAAVAGALMVGWIAAEVALLRTGSWLQVAFGAVGLVVLGMAWGAVRSKGKAWARWVAGVTLAEAIGFLAPVSVGVVSAQAGWSEGLQAVAVIGAGLVEGLCLGYGQARVWPLELPRARYALATAAGAALVWASVMGARLLVDGTVGGLVVVGGLVAVVGLGAIGGAQWLVLRRVGVRARPWMGWTALAWLLALPLSFLPAPLVDDRTPLWAGWLLWALGGVLMAHVMAWVTWVGVRASVRAPRVAAG